MPGISSIRVATDLSPHSEIAVRRAALVGRDMGVKKGMLVHALGLGRFGAFRELFSGGEQLEEELGEHARREMEALAARVKEETGVEFAVEVRKGSAVDAIVDVQDRNDLVVTGAKGFNSAGQIALGSTSERVVRSCENPVLIARNEPAGEYRKVLVAVDFSAHSRAALLYAKTVAPQAEIHLVHAYPEMPSSGQSFAGITSDDVKRYARQMEEKSDREIDSLLTECDMKRADVGVTMDHAYAPQLIWETADSTGADLVVMGKQGHSRLRDWVVGSVTAHVLPRCSSDVMIVRDTRRG